MCKPELRSVVSASGSCKVLSGLQDLHSVCKPQCRSVVGAVAKYLLV